MITYDKSLGKFVLKINGAIVARGSEGYCKNRLRKLGGNMKALKVGSNMPAPETKSEFSVDERFDFIKTFVKMLSKKAINSLILTGDGGLGKTFTVVETLKSLGLKELEYGIGDDDYSYGEGDFVVIKGFSTAKGLFRSLWEHNGKIIVFDDADSVHKDPIGANILKAALDSNDKRVISWNAEFSDKEEMPNRFEFFGRVIFISNLSLTKFPQPLLSRSMKVDLTLNQEEKLDRISYVLGESNIPPEDCDTIMAFLRKYADRITDLNVRSALNVAKLQQSGIENWERLGLYTMTAGSGAC
jgi:hypothetical protein